MYEYNYITSECTTVPQNLATILQPIYLLPHLLQPCSALMWKAKQSPNFKINTKGPSR